MESYDLLVIGGGSGGLATARRAAAHGAKVALIEGSRLGGTCVNVGCVPKKVMWNAASIAESIHNAKHYGFSVGESQLDWGQLKEQRDAYIKRLNDIYQRNLDKSNVKIIRGWARFEDPHTVSVDTGEGRISYRGEKILIATGGRPRMPGIPGEELGITSDGFFALEEMPQKVAIVGAGYIAVELAGVFNALGADVSLLYRKNDVLRSFDKMLSSRLLEQMAASGITLRPSTVLERLERTDDGKIALFASDRDCGEPVDCVLWAIGRVPLVSGLQLEKIGVEVNWSGHICVDDNEVTTVPHIYAIGDVASDRIELTPVAIAAGRKLADRLFADETEPFDYQDVPTVIFSHPPMGTVGYSEEEAIKHYGEDAVTCFTSRFTNMYYAFHPQEQKPTTAMKVVTLGPEHKVIGIHAIGMGVDEMIQGFAVALKMGATVADLKRTVAIHPTASEELVLVG